MTAAEIYPDRLTTDDLLMLLRNYSRLEQAGSRMFKQWGEDAEDPADAAMLEEFSQVEMHQASRIAAHMRDLGGHMTDGPVPMQDAIDLYLQQIALLPTLGERLRFNHMIMSNLERPIVVRVLLEHTSAETQELFSGILDNEDRILGWCDSRAHELGVDDIDVEKYFGNLVAEA